MQKTPFTEQIKNIQKLRCAAPTEAALPPPTLFFNPPLYPPEPLPNCRCVLPGLLPGEVEDDMNTAIDVLDHGFVRLVDHMGSDLSIVRAARVSYDAEWRTGEDEDKDEKLIGYLMRNKHTSPFEAVSLTFEVKAPIFVFRQWHRHRTWAYNEVSARYSELPEEFYIPAAEQITHQHASNKQMRDNVPHPMAELMRSYMTKQNLDAFALYKALLERGAPRELARTILPVATYSHMFATVNLHNLFHFLRLRLHAHAQYEIKVYAKAMLELAGYVAPVAVAAFIDSLDV